VYTMCILHVNAKHMQVRVFVGLVDVFKWCLSCFGLMCSVDAKRCIAAAQRKVSHTSLS
jgi:hypothetical protein